MSQSSRWEWGDDRYGATQEVADWFQVTQRDGKRCDTALAYLHAAARRGNAVHDAIRPVGARLDRLPIRAPNVLAALRAAAGPAAGKYRSAATKGGCPFSRRRSSARL